MTYKQSLGMRFVTETRILTSFTRTLGDVAIDEVTSDQVGAYLAGNGRLTRFWHRKLDALRGFYRFALARGYASASPLPTRVPRQFRAFVPYIYSRDEIRRLLAATADRERCSLSSTTCRTLLLLLYGTGSRIGEALALDRADVDLDSRLLCIRESKFYQKRLVPIGADITKVLGQYVAECHPPPPAPLVLTRRGQRPSRASAENAFKQLRVLTPLIAQRAPPERVFLNRCGQPMTRFGVHALVERSALTAKAHTPSLGKKRVSPHSIRHSTATHLLRAGVDINTMRAWLGHVSLDTTNVYAEIDLEGKAEALAKCGVAEPPDAEPGNFLRNHGLRDHRVHS